jgi:pimeloyl-ACP methyl ester carboxylesterase
MKAGSPSTGCLEPIQSELQSEFQSSSHELSLGNLWPKPGHKFVEIEIAFEYKDFSEEHLRKVLGAISDLIGISSPIELVMKFRGSVHLVIELTEEGATTLVRAIEDGKLHSLGVLRAAVIPLDHQVVLLIHGIRTEADWGPMVRSKLEVPGQVEVIPIKYGYFDAFRFWFPFWTRNKPIEKVYVQIRVALQKYKREHPDAKLSIIAHSFGTYVIGNILKRGFDLQVHRLILCGSVLRQDFPWEQYQGRFDDDKVINECGKSDIWPVLAQSCSWGYGASGTFGFGAVLVKDRFHAEGHGQYFHPEFVEKYWAPFIRRGKVESTDFEMTMPPTPWWVSLLGVLPIKWLIVGLFFLVFIFFGWAGSRSIGDGKDSLPITVPKGTENSNSTKQQEDAEKNDRSQRSSVLPRPSASTVYTDVHHPILIGDKDLLTPPSQDSLLDDLKGRFRVLCEGNESGGATIRGAKITGLILDSQTLMPVGGTLEIRVDLHHRHRTFRPNEPFPGSPGLVPYDNHNEIYVDYNLKDKRGTPVNVTGRIKYLTFDRTPDLSQIPSIDLLKWQKVNYTK